MSSLAEPTLGKTHSPSEAKSSYPDCLKKPLWWVDFQHWRVRDSSADAEKYGSGHPSIHPPLPRQTGSPSELCSPCARFNQLEKMSNPAHREDVFHGIGEKGLVDYLDFFEFLLQPGFGPGDVQFRPFSRQNCLRKEERGVLCLGNAG